MLVDNNTSRPEGFSVQFSHPMFNTKQWEEYKFVCDIPIDEDDRNNPDGPPYTHTMVAVRSGAKALLLTEKKRVTDYVINRILNRRIFPNLRKVRIHIEKLIDSCQEASSPYLISTLHGSFSGTDRHISRISLYGDDITESSLFREQRHLFNFYSCGITRRSEGDVRMQLGDDREVMLLGNDGFVSSQLTGADKARDIILLINYIMRNRWVDDWVPNIAMD